MNPIGRLSAACGRAECWSPVRRPCIMARMDDEIRIGIIGIGQIGSKHLFTYEQIPGARVVALADVNAPELSRVAAAHGIKDFYTDFRSLIARDDVQAVDVCLHNNLHMPVTVAALAAGKHVYCEKPMAGSYRDAEAMMAAAAKAGRRLSIQLNALFSAETQAARWLIQDGRLGRVYHGRTTGFRRRGRPFVDGYGSPAFVQKRLAGGGAVYDGGVYRITQMLYLLGNPLVERIGGATYQEIAIDEKRRAASGYDVEELGLGFVRLAGNLTMDIMECWAVLLDQLGGSVVLGSDGGVRLNPFAFFQSAGDLDLNCTADLNAFLYRQHNVRGVGDEYDSPQSHWVRALQGRVNLLPTAELALAAMLVSEGIYLSQRLHREVSAEEVKDSSVSNAMAV
jgi:predicted dehydrogenase